MHGAIAEYVHAQGVRSSVGAPVIVEGRLWGIAVVYWTREESPPADTEERIGQFAKLLETAIATPTAASSSSPRERVCWSPATRPVAGWSTTSTTAPSSGSCTRS